MPEKRKEKKKLSRIVIGLLAVFFVLIVIGNQIKKPAEEAELPEPADSAQLAEPAQKEEPHPCSFVKHDKVRFETDERPYWWEGLRESRENDNTGCKRRAIIALELVRLVRLYGYRCDSITFISEMFMSPGFDLKCNRYRYKYEIEDRGGTWVVTID